MLRETHERSAVTEKFARINYKAIHGNGQPGLLKDVVSLKTTNRMKGVLVVTGISFLGMLGTWAGVLYVLMNQQP